VVRICVDSTVHDDDNAIVGHSEKYTISSQDTESGCDNTKKTLLPGETAITISSWDYPLKPVGVPANREVCDTGN